MGLKIIDFASRREPGGPASGVAGVRVTIWQAEARDAKRRVRSDGQFVKRLRSRKARRNSRRGPGHGRADGIAVRIADRRQ